MGIFAQKTLLDLLNSSLKVECKKENGLDLRNFRVLMEHKNILCESLRFASYNIGMPSTIAERYRTDVKDAAVILFHLAIKYNVSYKEKLLLKMIDILNRLSVSEKFILTETLEYLNRMPIVKGCSV